jgi:hypothetical protein
MLQSNPFLVLIWGSVSASFAAVEPRTPRPVPPRIKLQPGGKHSIIIVIIIIIIIKLFRKVVKSCY